MSENTVSRLLTGRVTSDKRDKTRTIEVHWSLRHPQYNKVVRKVSKYHVHDSANISKLGDLIEIKQCRPMSKTKNWEIVRVVEQAVVA